MTKVKPPPARKVQWVGPVSTSGPSPDDAYADLAALEKQDDTEWRQP